jgi:hypothetical protein
MDKTSEEQGLGNTVIFKLCDSKSPMPSGMGFPITGLIIRDPAIDELFQMPVEFQKISVWLLL